MIVKLFNLHLLNGAIVPVQADSHHLKGDHYVFVKSDGTVQFFKQGQVSGIVEVPPPQPFIPVPRKPRSLDG